MRELEVHKELLKEKQNEILRLEIALKSLERDYKFLLVDQMEIVQENSKLSAHVDHLNTVGAEDKKSIYNLRREVNDANAKKTVLAKKYKSLNNKYTKLRDKK
jgi:chromosome segregation ATPase